MPELPSGTVTFLFTDIEGSTALWERDPDAMRAAAARHDHLLGSAIQHHHGYLYKHVGDAVQAAFSNASDGLAAAVAAQLALTSGPWPETGPLRVRMALHLGEATPDAGGDYHQVPALNRLARLLGAGHGGQVLVSAVVRDHVTTLPSGVTMKDLGKHRLRDLLEPERVYQVVIAGIPDHFPPLKSLERHPTNLPVQPNALIGRERELADVQRLLSDETVRLVTLTGPGGSGKTRLALQAAANLLDDYDDGAFFIDLAPVSDPTIVLSTIAATLGVREVAGQSLHDSLVAYLADKHLLLVLDNFEHLLRGASVVGNLLAAAPDVRILATSRAPLRLRAEREFPVAPLNVPDPGGQQPEDQLLEYEAVRLFIDRATAVKPAFTVSHQDAALIAEICWKLDGLPLAIELAAARIRLLPLTALLSRLERRLGLLTGGARDAPDRQRTLRDTITWSYDLLAPEEQMVLRWLAVFSGGFTLDAVENVADAMSANVRDGAASGPLPRDEQVLDAVASLVDHSLVRLVRGTDDQPRYDLLQTIREFAWDLLVAHGEHLVAQRSHAEFFAGLVERAYPQLSGPDQSAWYNRLTAENDNIRAALTSAVGERDTVLAQRIARWLWKFWRTRGQLAEGRTWLDHVLELAKAGISEARADCLRGAASLAEDQGDYERAVQLYNEALAGARMTQSRLLEANVLDALGNVAHDQGRFDEAERLHRQALDLYEQLGDQRGRAICLHNLGAVNYFRGNLEAAASAYEHAIGLMQSFGDRRGAAVALANLGAVADVQGDYERARHCHEESLRELQALGDEIGVANTLVSLGTAYQKLGDLPQARALNTEALERLERMGVKRTAVIARWNLADITMEEGNIQRAIDLLRVALAGAWECGDATTTAELLGAMGKALARAEDWRRAAFLLGASDHLSRSLGIPPPPEVQDVPDSVVATVRDAIGAEFEAVWDEGTATSLEMAVMSVLGTRQPGMIDGHVLRSASGRL